MGAALDQVLADAIPPPRGGPKAPHVRRDLAKSAEAVAHELARCYRDARHGRISTADGYRLASILNILGRLLETADLERRVEELEKTMTTDRSRVA